MTDNPLDKLPPEADPEFMAKLAVAFRTMELSLGHGGAGSLYIQHDCAGTYAQEAGKLAQRLKEEKP